MESPGTTICDVLLSGPRDADDETPVIEALVRVPLPDAESWLLNRLDRCRLELRTEGRRDPGRMLRVLATQAVAGNAGAGELLPGQALRYADITVDDLPLGARALVGAIRDAAAPRPDAAPAELIPEALSAGKPGAVPAWVLPPLLPPVRLRGGGHTLPVPAVHNLCGLLAKGSVPEEIGPACEPDDLAALAREVFAQWERVGFPSDPTALTALAVFGDDTGVGTLAAYLPDWSVWRLWHYRQSLDALVTLGSDEALKQLQRLGRTAGSKVARKRATERIPDAAAARGLTPAELADRLVPDFGLDADGRMTVDYGNDGSRSRSTIGSGLSSPGPAGGC